MKKCPACAEEIKDEAIKCRYCGERLPELRRNLYGQPLPDASNAPAINKPRNALEQAVYKGKLALGALFGFLALCLIIALSQSGYDPDSPAARAERATQARRESVRNNWPSMLERGRAQMKQGDYNAAQATFREMLDARSDAADIKTLLANAEAGARQLEKARQERQRQDAELVKAKKARIEELAQQFVSSLPRLEGREELIVVGMTNYGVRVCQGATHSHRITWLNSAKTKAKVSVSRHCDYPVKFGQTRMITTTKDYKGGTFTCEETADGIWRITR